MGLVDPQVAADAQPVLQRLRKDDLVRLHVVDVRAEHVRFEQVTVAEEARDTGVMSKTDLPVGWEASSQWNWTYARSKRPSLTAKAKMFPSGERLLFRLAAAARTHTSSL